ncbi:MAG: MoxR family ATPase [Oscillospiraceae bacterium]|nr:MoxR family ATPase [Oscillospiraceae bacterium]
MKYAAYARLVTNEVEKAIIGKQDCIHKVMTAILAKGHVLIEDIPGVGKTTMALAFAKAMDLEQNRIQFTPDVLPSDITGFTMYRKETGEFVYHPGAVMCNLFLADEINRTTAKTQSALLEVMEESAVTVDGVTRPVPEPFLVIATENPIGSAGTQMLPESQLDRFMICTAMGYPDAVDEVRILEEQALDRPLTHVQKVISRQQLLLMQREVEQVYTHPMVYQYIVALSQATRQSPYLSLGLSPRASLAAASMARANAYLNGRKFTLPDDVQAIFKDVAQHRLRLSPQAQTERKSVDQVLDEILKTVKKPRAEVTNEK